MMSRDDVGRLALSIALITIAGWVDAMGFLQVGHLFVSFMSGDSTEAAVAASQLDWERAGAAGAIVGTFVLAVIAGRLLGLWTRPRSRPVILLTEAGLMGCAALLGSSARRVAIVLMVAAMGIQNAAVHKADGTKVGLTYVTGTLVSMGESLADAIRTGSREQRWKWLPYLLLWLGLMLGAAAGALAYRAMHLRGLLLPAAVLIILAAITAMSVPRQTAAH